MKFKKIDKRFAVIYDRYGNPIPSASSTPDPSMVTPPPTSGSVSPTSTSTPTPPPTPSYKRVSDQGVKRGFVMQQNGKTLDRLVDDDGNLKGYVDSLGNQYMKDGKGGYIDSNNNSVKLDSTYLDDRSALGKFWDKFKSKVNSKANAIAKYYKNQGKWATTGGGGFDNKHNILRVAKNAAGSALRGAGRLAATTAVGGVLSAIPGANIATLPVMQMMHGALRTRNRAKGNSFKDALAEARLRGNKAKMDQAIQSAYGSGKVNIDQMSPVAGLPGDQRAQQFRNADMELHNAVMPVSGANKFRDFLSGSFGLGALGITNRGRAKRLSREYKRMRDSYNRVANN